MGNDRSNIFSEKIGLLFMQTWKEMQDSEEKKHGRFRAIWWCARKALEIFSPRLQILKVDYLTHGEEEKIKYLFHIFYYCIYLPTTILPCRHYIQLNTWMLNFIQDGRNIAKFMHNEYTLLNFFTTFFFLQTWITNITLLFFNICWKCFKI